MIRTIVSSLAPLLMGRVETDVTKFEGREVVIYSGMTMGEAPSVMIIQNYWRRIIFLSNQYKKKRRHS